MTTKLYLDARHSNDAPAPLKLSITKHGKAAYVNLELRILPEHWDAKTQKVIVHPEKRMLNNIIAGKKFDIDRKLIELEEDGKTATLSAKQIRDLLTKEDKTITFGDVFNEFMEKKKARTREIYEATWVHIQRHAKPYSMSLEDITPRWLEGFDEYLSSHSPARNARNIHLRNIRAVVNYAVENDMTTYYAFRKFKIRNEETRKRSLDVETLTKVFTMDVPKRDGKFQKAFMLMFYLIGINTIDFCNMELTDGRITYRRRKTSKLYSIKAEPEILELVEDLHGTNHLVYPLDHYKDYKTFAQKLNNALSRMSDTLGIPKITTYWARHTWATIAHRIGIPKDTISMALGHSFGNKVTDIYVDYDSEVVDDANRKVIDHIKERIQKHPCPASHDEG